MGIILDVLGGPSYENPHSFATGVHLSLDVDYFLQYLED